MRRTLIAVCMIFVAMLLVVPAHAVPLPVLTCRWDGFIHVDSDWSMEGLLLSIASGSGRCTGDGGGPYDVTIGTGLGTYEIGNSFSFYVRFELRSEQDGSVETLEQNWDGRVSSDCTLGPFTVESDYLPVGVGNLSLCPSLDGAFPPPEPIDVPAHFGWRFDPAIPTLPFPA
jgi:hypothetical protein